MIETPRDQGPIKVSDISIAQLSRGLYRSNAAAFKELVTNSWDADAGEVRIDTNFPEFDFIACVDDGPGMRLDQFRNYFAEKGIGFCYKRKGGKTVTDKHRRPIIGRLGIGMLAMGQLCHSFDIESHYVDEDGTGKAYRATITLVDQDVQDVDEILSLDRTDQAEDIDVGKWSYEVIPFDESRTGFRLYSSDVRQTFMQEMKRSVVDGGPKDVPNNLDALHSSFFRNLDKSVRECRPYLETIWELCVLCPLPYCHAEGSPIDRELFEGDEGQKATELINRRQAELEGYRFKVVFDGIELKRHIEFPTKAGASSRVFYLSHDGAVAGKNLKYEGYIFAQTQAIRPLELNGVQIRLRGVGIGGYDSTFLHYYKQIETIRSRWVSGEIFVDRGLEVALNIDRDSFNEHDEHYKELQTRLHEKLDSVFKTIEGIAQRQRESARSRKSGQLKDRLKSVISNRLEGRFALLEQDLGADAPLVSVDDSKKRIILNTSLRRLRKKKANTILSHVALAYEVSKKISSNEREQSRQFEEILVDILDVLV